MSEISVVAAGSLDLVAFIDQMPTSRLKNGILMLVEAG
jgi:hypothetical protein